MAALALIGLAGCWPLFTPIEPAHRTSFHSATQPVSGPRSSDNDRAVKTARRHVTRMTPNKVPEDRTQSTDTSTPAKPSVTLAGEDESRVNAEHLLYEVDHRLTAIDRAKLSAASVATYEEASQFQASAHQALAARDYLVASGLAEKASVLTARLETSSSTSR